MTVINKLGTLGYGYDKLKAVAEWGKIAIESADPETRKNAALEAATKLGEAAGVGIPLWFLDKALTKTGLERVFDSLKKNRPF